MVATMMSKMLVVMTRCRGLVTANAVVDRLSQSVSQSFPSRSHGDMQLTVRRRFSIAHS